MKDLDGKPLLQQFYDDMEDVLSRYMNNGLSLAEILGSLDMLKLEFWFAQHDGVDEEEPNV